MGTLKAINIDYPIDKGTGGFFKQTYETLSAVRSKILILLKTEKNERIFNPSFGLNLKKYLFDNISQEFMIDSIRDDIYSSLEKYVPEAKIDNLEIEVDENTININVTFSLKKDLSQTTTLNVIL